MRLSSSKTRQTDRHAGSFLSVSLYAARFFYGSVEWLRHKATFLKQVYEGEMIRAVIDKKYLSVIDKIITDTLLRFDSANQIQNE